MESSNTEQQNSVNTVVTYLHASNNHKAAFWQRHNVTTLAASMNRDVFNFCYEFYKHGFDLNELNLHQSNLTELSDKKNQAKEQLLALWQYLRQQFVERKDLDDNATQQQFRNLKRLFNRMARQLGVNLRLRHKQKNNHNLEELYNALAKQKRSDKYLLDYILCAEDDTDESLQTLSKDASAAARRKQRQRVMQLSLVASVLVAIGEAIVAAHFAPVLFGAATLTFATVLACALVSNFILFRAATSITFKEMAFGRIYINKDGEDLSKSPLFSNFVMPLVLSLVVGSGLGFSVLSFGSAYLGISGMFPALLVAGCTPWGLLAISTVLAVSGFLCLSSLFYSSLVTDIKNGIVYKLYLASNKGGWSGVKKVLSDYCKAMVADANGQITAYSIATTLLKKLIIIAAFVFVSIATAGMFNAMTFSVVHSMWGVEAVLSHALAFASTILALPVNSYFQYKSIEVCLDLTVRLSKSVASWFMSFNDKDNAEKNPNNKELESTTNDIRKMEQTYSAIKFFGVAICVSANGAGQGWGVTKPQDVSLVHNVLYFISRPIIKWVNFFTKMSCSNGANFQASLETTHAGLECGRQRTAASDGADADDGAASDSTLGGNSRNGSPAVYGGP